MFVTATQVNSGQSGVISPSAHAGQCWRGSLDTRGSMSNCLSSAGSVTAHATTCPGSSTSAAGPLSRIRAASPWISLPDGSMTTGWA